MLIKLPTGFTDGADFFNMVEIGEICGKQQNYLVDKALILNNIGHVPKLLGDLIKSFQTEQGLQWKGDIVKEGIWKITSGDIETILIKIRENTYGPKFYHEATCSHCGKLHKDVKTELDKLEISPLPLEERFVPKIIVLPKSKLEVEFKPLYLKDLFDSLKYTQNNQDSLVTSLTSLTIKRIGNKTNITPSDIDNIPASDLKFLKEKQEDINLEGSIDTDIIIECSDCKKDFTVKLNCFDPNFFFPTEESTN